MADVLFTVGRRCRFANGARRRSRTDGRTSIIWGESSSCRMWPLGIAKSGNRNSNDRDNRGCRVNRAVSWQGRTYSPKNRDRRLGCASGGRDFQRPDRRRSISGGVLAWPFRSGELTAWNLSVQSRCQGASRRGLAILTSRRGAGGYATRVAIRYASVSVVCARLAGSGVCFAVI